MWQVILSQLTLNSVPLICSSYNETSDTSPLERWGLCLLQLKLGGFFDHHFNQEYSGNKAMCLFKTWSQKGLQVLWGQKLSLFPLLLWNMRRNTAQVCGHTVWHTHYMNVCLKLALLISEGELTCEYYSDAKWVSEESESGVRNCSESNTSHPAK